MVAVNQPFEVSQATFHILDNVFAGIVATRQEQGKYFVKLMIPTYESHLNNFLNKLHENLH